MESEGGERREKTKKKKREKPEMPKDQAPTAALGEDDSNEGGGYEAHLEQLMLSPTVDQRIPAQAGAMNEESSSAEQLFAQEQRKKGKTESCN